MSAEVVKIIGPIIGVGCGLIAMTVYLIIKNRRKKD